MKKKEPIYYKSGVMIPFLGERELILRVRRNFYIKGTTIETKESSAEKQFLVIETDNDSQRFVQYCVVSYYEKCARGLIDMQLPFLAKRMDIPYDDVQIVMCGENIVLENLSDFTEQVSKLRDKETVWSSYDREKKLLKFDWKLAMLPMEIAEYLFVIELMHLKMNQNQETFWDEVAAVMPNYQMCRDWFEVHKDEYENY